MTPEEWIARGPTVPQELIGKAGAVARVYCNKVKAGTILPLRLLFHGPPGCGKTSCCRLLAHTLAPHATNIRHTSAAQVTVDHVKDWIAGLRYHTDTWQVWWIDEVDAVNPTVEVLLLQFLDEMPTMHAFLATSNEQMTGISQRFQSRTHAVGFTAPSADEVHRFLIRLWPSLGPVAREIAEACGGDVRQALNDAQMQMDVVSSGGGQ